MGRGPRHGGPNPAGRLHHPGAFLDRITAAYAAGPMPPSLLSDKDFAAAQDDWWSVVVAAVTHRAPAPGSSAALAHHDAVGAKRLPATLTRAQRDFLNAHT